MLNCDRGLKADENWMSTETSWVRDAARGQRDMADDQCAKVIITIMIINEYIIPQVSK